MTDNIISFPLGTDRTPSPPAPATNDEHATQLPTPGRAAPHIEEITKVLLETANDIENVVLVVRYKPAPTGDQAAPVHLMATPISIEELCFSVKMLEQALLRRMAAEM